MFSTLLPIPPKEIVSLCPPGAWGCFPGSGFLGSGMEKSLSLGARMPGFHFWLCLQLRHDRVRSSLWALVSFL